MTSIDVAIPNYQYGRYLRECVESVLSQGVPELRVLIIDNASTDNSAEVAQQLAVDHARVHFVRHGAI
jgi:glycosyltransferase involved in cell wall biosynthesis